MSEATLMNLRDYLCGALKPADMMWLASELTERAKEEEPLKPYTKEELVARIERSEQQFAEGKYKDFDEAMDELEREFAEEEQEYELAEAV